VIKIPLYYLRIIVVLQDVTTVCTDVYGLGDMVTNGRFDAQMDGALQGLNLVNVINCLDFARDMTNEVKDAPRALEVFQRWTRRQGFEFFCYKT